MRETQTYNQLSYFIQTINSLSNTTVRWLWSQLWLNNHTNANHTILQQHISIENKTKLETLAKKVKELSENFYILLGSVDDLERTIKYLEHHLEKLSEQSQNLKCNQCGQTLNEHVRRHHRTPKT